MRELSLTLYYSNNKNKGGSGSTYRSSKENITIEGGAIAHTIETCWSLESLLNHEELPSLFGGRLLEYSVRQIIRILLEV